MGRRSWRLALTVLAGLGELAVAGRLLDVAEDRPPAMRPSPSSAAVQPMASPTAPHHEGSPQRCAGGCSSPARGGKDRNTVAVGDGPVYPVFFKNTADGGLARASSVYWVAPRPLGGVAIVRGHRLGAPEDRVRDKDQKVDVVQVLDPAPAGQTDSQGHGWITFLLRAGVGCYGLQIDAPRFRKVLVVQFRS